VLDPQWFTRWFNSNHLDITGDNSIIETPAHNPVRPVRELALQFEAPGKSLFEQITAGYGVIISEDYKTEIKGITFS
jgi:hypothetical protein